MKIYRQDKLLDYGKMEEQWRAEETVGEGLLKYRKVVFAPTKVEAIDKMLTELYQIKLHETRTHQGNGQAV